MTLPIIESSGSHLVFYFGLFASQMLTMGPPKARLSDKRQNISI